MSPPCAELFPSSKLDALADVADTTALDQAQATLQALGFEAVAPVELQQDRSAGVPPGVWTHGRSGPRLAWVHPQGMMVAAQGHHDGNIYNVRAVALVDIGWQEPPSFSRVRVVETPQDDGSRLLNLTVAADQLGDRTLFTFLRELGEHDLALEGFDRWGEQLEQGRGRSWLFCLGNDSLESIAQEHTIDRWLEDAPDSLIAFVKKRLEDQLKSSATQAPTQPWNDWTNTFLRRQMRASGQARPSSDPEQRQHIAQWIDMGTGQSRMKRDWTSAPGTGVMLPHVLALLSTEARAQARLRKWIEDAPLKALKQAFFTPLPTGENPIASTIIEGALSGEIARQAKGRLPVGRAGQPSPKAPLNSAAQALEALMQRHPENRAVEMSTVLAQLESVIDNTLLTTGNAFNAEFFHNLVDFLAQVRQWEKQSGQPRPLSGTGEKPSVEHMSLAQWGDRLEARFPRLNLQGLCAQLTQWSMEDSLACEQSSKPLARARL